MKIPNYKEIQQIAPNDSSDNDFKDLKKLYKDYTKELHSFLVNDTTWLLDNSLDEMIRWSLPKKGKTKYSKPNLICSRQFLQLKSR